MLRVIMVIMFGLRSALKQEFELDTPDPTLKSAGYSEGFVSGGHLGEHHGPHSQLYFCIVSFFFRKGCHQSQYSWYTYYSTRYSYINIYSIIIFYLFIYYYFFNFY